MGPLKNVLKTIYFAVRRVFIAVFLKTVKKPMLLSAHDRVLVFRLDRIGDLVLSTPVFRALKERYPGIRISAMVRRNTAAIIQNNPYIDEILLYEGFFKTLLRCRKRFDAVIDLYMDYDLLPALIARYLKAAHTLGFDIGGRGALFTSPVPLSAEKKHFLAHLFDLLAPLGIYQNVHSRPEIFVDAETRDAVDRCLEERGITGGSPIISLHPGGFYPAQRWPKESFAELADRLMDRFPGTAVCIFGNQAERYIITSIAGILERSAKGTVLTFIDEPLLRTIACIRRSSLFIGNNSGLLHIAAAVGTPTLSTMGPTVPWMWHPFGEPDKNIVLRTGQPCSPCNRGICGDHRCLGLITVDDMMTKAEELLVRTQ